MYIKTYTLLAQSPIIHFQPGQEGATLRATEVKPKLDRYLRQRLGRVPPEWLLPGQEKALNYKLRFLRASGVKIIELGPKTPYDIFYGNMGAGPKKKGVIANVSMTVICMIPALLDEIEKHIGDFFIAHNFGAMQDKGFGSFVVDGADHAPRRIAAVLRETYGAKACYSFIHNETPFKQIKSLYATMKSGVSYASPKQPSLLFRYMREEYDIGNDKDWIKQTDLVPTRGKRPQPTANGQNSYYYVRALLGLADHISFKGSTDSVKISDQDGNIERLASPILFKIIGDRVYYVARRLNDKIYGATFSFSLGNRAHMKLYTLNVPTKEQLGKGFIDDFLEYCFGKLEHKFKLNKVEGAVY